MSLRKEFSARMEEINLNDFNAVAVSNMSTTPEEWQFRNLVLGQMMDPTLKAFAEVMFQKTEFIRHIQYDYNQLRTRLDKVEKENHVLRELVFERLDGEDHS